MQHNKWGNRVIAAGLVMVLFASPHLIDDFLYGIPEDFGLTNQQTQVLAGLFHIQLIVCFIWVSRKRKIGYYGMLFWGLILSLAGILKHLPAILKPEPYWSGLFSEALIIGLIISSMILAVISILALGQLKNKDTF
jgi:hypothetical protein